MKENPDTPIVEMDSVEGKKGRQHFTYYSLLLIVLLCLPFLENIMMLNQ